MIGLLPSVLVTLAAYRIARLIAADSITDPFRMWLWERGYHEDGHTKSKSWSWAYKGFSCFQCVSVWSAFIGWGLWRWVPDLHAVTQVVAVAGAASFLWAVHSK